MPFPLNVSMVPVGPSAVAPSGLLPFQGLTILVVEDSRFTCDALRLIFLRAGGRLRRAETLDRARAYLARFRPDLAIVDLGLPDGRGEGLIAELAANGVPVLGMSGDSAGRSSVLACGAAGFVEKPFGPIAAFQAMILGLLGREPAGLPNLGAIPAAEAMADPLAFQDDLLRASALIGRAEMPGADPSDAGYAAGFLRSLGRAAGDGDLEQAAPGVATAPGRAKLTVLLADRLRAKPPTPARPLA
jgi:CheY-like chemotaxis protein